MDFSEIPDDISEHSHISDFLEELGFELEITRCGNNVDYDKFARWNPTGFEAQIDPLDFIRAVEQALEPRLHEFRNIVFTVTDGRWLANISISRSRLMNIANGDDSPSSLRWALTHIWDALFSGNYLDIYDDYEESYKKWFDKYGKPMDYFHIDTSVFAIVHNRSPAGAGIKHIINFNNILIEDSPDLYGFNNCLFNCITSVTLCQYTIQQIDELRKRLKYSNNSPIKLKHMIYIARVTKTNIIVFKDCLNNDMIPKTISEIKINKEYPNVNIVLHGGHYFVYKGINFNSDVIYEEQITYKRILFYDMETYFDPTTKNIQPYCFSYCYFDIQNNMQKKGHIIKSSINDDIKKNIFGFFNNFAENNNHTLIVGFNNGAFDDYLLLDILSDHRKKLIFTLIDKRGRVLKFVWGSLHSKDVYRFLMTSLRNAAKSFKCNTQKLEINHEDIQRSVNMGTYDKYMTNDIIDKIGKYAEVDVVSLAELYFKIVKEFKNIDDNLDVTKSLTISHMSMNAFKTNLHKQYINVKNVHKKLPILSNKLQNDFVQLSIIGGRCDVFQKGEFHNVTMVDVCSLYPHIMIENKFPYFIEKYDYYAKCYKTVDIPFKHTTKYVPDVCGIYNVMIISQPKDAIVPLLTNDGTYNWHYTKSFNRWITHVSLEMLKTYGCKFSVIEGWIFDCDNDYIIRDFLKPIMELKRQQDLYKKNNDLRFNSALRECLKLIMNALSGKMCQSPITTERILTDDHNKCDVLTAKYRYSPILLIRDKLWLLDCEKDKPTILSPTIIGSMIFDLARKYMYENVITKVTQKYYMDTDSMLMDISGLDEIDKNMFGDDHGKLKIELDHNNGPFHAIVAAKKCYCIYTIDDKGNEIIHKFRIKGINVDQDRLLIDKDIVVAKNAILNKNYEKLDEIYDKSRSVKTIEFMRQLCNNETVNVLCSQIFRSLKGSMHTESFMIKSRYIIKKLPFKHNEELIVESE
jgi:hypothetical protein